MRKGKKATIKDISIATGVSISTVSRVLNGIDPVADETKIAVMKAATSLGYIKSSKSLIREKGKPGLIYLIMKYSKRNSYEKLVQESITAVAAENNMRTISVSQELDRIGLQNYQPNLILHIEEAKSLGVNGIILASFVDELMTESIMNLLTSCQIPIVFINRSASVYSFNCVYSDGKVGSFFAAQHLIQNKRKTLLFVARNRHVRREAGVDEAIKASGKADVRKINLYLDDELSIDEELQQLADVFRKNPSIDGVQCTADELAAIVIRFLSSVGKSIPDDVEVIGYNDNLAPILNPPIPSVKVPVEEMARTAIDMIIGNSDPSNSNTRTVVFEPKLVLR